MTPARRARRGPLAAALVAAAALAWLLASEYQLALMNYAGIAALVVLGIVLLTGVGGVTSFGQAAFVGIGAYATAVLTTGFGWSPWATLPVALAVTGAIAWVLGKVSLRLSGHFLPVATMAWCIAIYYAFANVKGLGGHGGLSGLPALSVLGLELAGNRGLFVPIWIAVALAALGVTNLLDSRAGRAIRSLPGGGLAAEAFGVDTAALKTRVFVAAALLAALAGWFYAHLMRFVSPSPFSLSSSIEYFFMGVIGGLGHVWGALVGSVLVTFLKQWLQGTLPELIGSTGNFEIVVFGAVVILMLQWAPRGIVPLAMRLRAARHAAATPAAAPAATAAATPAATPAVAVEPLSRRSRPAAGEPLLVATGLAKSFGGLAAVSGMSLEVRGHEIVGLIGPNGAGKTTMFNLLTGVISPDRGEVRLAGQRIDGLPARRIVARGLARTFQHVHLRADMSALENAALGAHLRGRDGLLRSALRLDRATEARLLAEARRQLERVGLAESASVPAGSLALGQQRLLEIARALCADPVLLLLDEPAAGLRHREKEALAQLLRRLRDEGVAVLIVEHDMDFVMGLVDRLAVMSFGAPIAYGSAREIRRHPAVIEAYLGASA